jgi:hypothetical protein
LVGADFAGGLGSGCWLWGAHLAVLAPLVPNSGLDSVNGSSNGVSRCNES